MAERLHYVLVDLLIRYDTMLSNGNSDLLLPGGWWFTRAARDDHTGQRRDAARRFTRNQRLARAELREQVAELLYAFAAHTGPLLSVDLAVGESPGSVFGKTAIPNRNHIGGGHAYTPRDRMQRRVLEVDQMPHFKRHMDHRFELLRAAEAEAIRHFGDPSRDAYRGEYWNKKKPPPEFFLLRADYKFRVPAGRYLKDVLAAKSDLELVSVDEASDMKAATAPAR